MKLASSWLSFLPLLLLLWHSRAQAQSDRYEQDWKAIEQLEQDGLTKSALEATQKLYKKMKDTPNDPQEDAQLIKALLITNKYQVQLEEDGLVKAIARLEKEAETATFPRSAVLQSMLGELYNNYLRQNVYKFQDRTATTDFDPADVQTWDLSRLTNKIYNLYQASLANKKSQSINLQTFAPILTKGENTEGLRPTLYDFLVHRALDFYRSDQYYLTQPAYQFYLEEEEDFATAAVFVQRQLNAKDSTSPKFQAMLLFQEALRFHQNDQDKAAFMDLNLSRLRFVQENSVLTDKDALLEARLKSLYETYKQDPISTSVLYDLAQLYYQQGQKYQRGKEDPNRWKLKEAHEWCNKAIAQHPKSYGANLCKSLLSQIDQKSMQLQLEKIVSIKRDGLALLSYKNFERIYLKAVRVNDREFDKLNELYGEEYSNYLTKISGSYNWDYQLPDEGDFQTHSTEIALPPLPGGRYVIAASTDEDFRYKKNAFAYADLYVSDLRIFQSERDNQKEYGVVNASTGIPVPDAQVEFLADKRNVLGRNTTQVITTKKTDKDGFFKDDDMASKSTNRSYRIRVTKGDDVLLLEDTYYSYYYNNTREPASRFSTSFFLDRAIYRPGQTIYFKGLVLEHRPNQKVPDLVTKSKRTVTLYDANNQKVTDLELTTNDYGTFNGSFNAPTGGLLGQMRLVDEVTRSTQYFRVEEYKRPKFEVKDLPVEVAYKLGDSVTVKGQAKAFAGNNIDGATVRYRVVRQVRFPYWNWRWGWYIPYQQEQQQMTFGETTTNDQGDYSITFEAQPDRSIPADRRPSFTYYVYADVVDITGETHSATSTVKVGYVALDLTVQLPELLEKEDADSIILESRNLNGQFEAATGTILVERLKTPTKVYKNRYWQKPDYYVLDRATFDKKFPYLAYQDEAEKELWAVEQTMQQTDFDTKVHAKVAFREVENWPQGDYKVTVKSQDKYGEKIELSRFFTLYDKTANTVPTNAPLFVPQSFANIEPDTTLSVNMGSADLSAYLLYEVEHDGEMVERRWVQPRGIQALEVAIREKHRGNLHLYFTSIQQGRFYTETKTIFVPWSNKQLSIEYATFRDKLYPGQDETWTLKITGPDGEQVSAELLASMYDASLDAFAVNSWNVDFLTTTNPTFRWNGYRSFTTVNARIVSQEWNAAYSVLQRVYQELDWHEFPFQMSPYYYRNDRMYAVSGPAEKSARSKSSPRLQSAPALESAMSADVVQEEVEMSRVADATAGGAGEAEPPAPQMPDDEADLEEVAVRTNLNETVFFFPDLKTDAEGNLLIQFKMNEALTRWKLQVFGHTQDLKYGYSTKTVVTQKDLMVVPNAPRFFREGDEIYFSAKVSNLTEKALQGTAKLMLFDALTLEPLDAQFALSNTVLNFETKPGGSDALNWKIKVPNSWTRPLVHRVVAKSGNFSDGEESTLPVLTNRMLVTETQPLPVRGQQTKTFDFERLRTASQSSSLTQHKLTLEFTQNPAWYALQSLPYLMEYPYECTEQIFSRYYANSLASDVANSHPKIKRVFDQWKNIDTDALTSNLSKNEELKYALLEETPWVLQAQSEELQKKNLGILFDLNRMGNELTSAKRKIVERQSGDGGFSWMPGGRDNWYITQYLVEGFGRLQQLGIEDFKKDAHMQTMLNRAITYIDKELADNYTELLKFAKRSEEEKIYLERNNLSAIVVHYFYTRAMFSENTITNKTTLEALTYYEDQVKTYWTEQPRYLQGMLALGLHRWNKDTETVQKIVASARENALHNDEMGMYWKYPSGYYWYQLPIETHALMIELFDVVAKDEKAVEELKIWLLKAKQTTHWKTTKATAAACYALLRTGDNWLLDDQDIAITMGNKKLDQSDLKKEAGTGYFKTTWEGKAITPKMAKIKVSNPNKGIAWGAMYWQYFEDLDKITHFQETPLKLDKKVFKKMNTDRGQVLQPVDKTTLSPGDLVTIRIELRVDRNMEYVHMKDLRASGLEPVSVLSQYKYQDGLGYYESTRDASTNFFFSYLSKGTYVFEYDLRVNHKGEFSNGVTTIQCMYAPEYTAHSEGVRITVK